MIRKWESMASPGSFLDIRKWISGIFPVFCALSLAFFLHPLFAGDGAELIYAFRSYDALRSEKMLLVGEIRTKTKAPEPFKTDTPFLNYDNRLDFITIKVLNRQGIKVGQKLYVIDKKPFHKQHRNGLIMGEVIVRSIIHNPFYGWVITASGNLLRVREGHFVARTLDSENLEKAYIMKKKGDHFYFRGEIDRAIASYSVALEQDATLPEAHAALGRIYLEEARRNGYEDPVRAVGEFEAAWKSRENFRYSYDADQFFLDYMDSLIHRYEVRMLRTYTNGSERKFLDMVLEVGQEALKGGEDMQRDAKSRMFFASFRAMESYGNTASREERDGLDRSKKMAGKLLLELLDIPDDSSILHRGAVLYYNYLLKQTNGVSEIELREIVKKYYLSPVYRLHRSGRVMAPASGTETMLRDMIDFHKSMYLRTLSTGVKPEREVLDAGEDL